MEATYDREAQTMYFEFSNRGLDGSTEELIEDEVLIDKNCDGEITGIEITGVTSIKDITRSSYKTPDNPDGYEIDLPKPTSLPAFPDEPQPDEGRLLTDEELVEKCMPTVERFEEVEGQVFYPIPKPPEFSATIRVYASRMSREAVRKTARIKDQECKQRVERIFKEIEDRFGYFTDEGLAKIIVDDGGYFGHEGSLKEWQALKKKEGL